MISDKDIEKAYEKAIEAIEKILGKTEDVQGSAEGETLVWEGETIRLVISIEENIDLENCGHETVVFEGESFAYCADCGKQLLNE